MKKISIFFAIVILSITSYSQPGSSNVALQHREYIESLLYSVGIEKHDITTGVLYDFIIPIASLQRYKQGRPVNREFYMQAALELRNASYDTLLHRTTRDLKRIADIYYYRDGLIPLGLLHSHFTHIDTLAVEKGLIIVDGQGKPRPTGRLIREGLVNRELLMVSVLSDVKTFEPQVRFTLPTELLVGNSVGDITSIVADFADGLGFRPVTLDVPVGVNYTTTGTKTITLKTTTAKGQTLISTTTIDIRGTVNWGSYGINVDRQVPIYAQLSYSDSQGGNFPGLGLLTTLYRHTDKKLRKPVLIVDGFDPGNENYDERLFANYLNTNEFPFADSLYIAGYDVVILDMPKAYNKFPNRVVDGGADFIQRNAFLAVKVIDTLNYILQQNGSSEPLVVIGPSMGGLITRFALAYMEQNGKNHNTRLWISFDSPHKGANIPIGAQHFIKYFSSISEGAEEALEKIKSPAARQMVIDHYLANSEYPLGDPDNNVQWNNELSIMGFPNQLRKISITNGSIDGTLISSSCSRAVRMSIKGLFIWGWTEIGWGNIYTTTGFGNRCLVFKGIEPLSFSTTSKFAKGYSNSSSLDSSPGGIRNTFDEMKNDIFGIYNIGDNFLAYKIDWTVPIKTHSFIPTKSALAFTGNNADLSENISLRNLASTGETPFQSYWGPKTKNMDHVSFDSDLMCWVLNEINGIPMPPSITNTISGPTTVCTSNTTFTLNNLPAGCTVSWTRSSNLTYVSGQGTASYTVKASSSTVNGAGWVQATVSGPCGDVEVDPYDVWVGTPPSARPTVQLNPGFSSVCKGETHLATVSPQAGITDYQWRLIYPDGFSWSLPSGGSSTTFCINSTGGHYRVGVKQRTDGCSWSQEVTTSFYVEDCGTGGTCDGGGLVPRLIVSPNPTSYEVTIAEVEPANDNIPWVLRLMSPRGAEMVNVTTTLPKTINVQGLHPGVYVLHARRGEYVEQLRVVVE